MSKPSSVLDKLHSAIRNSDLSDVKKLLLIGAHANQPLKDGTLPLELAATARSIPILAALLDAGADIDAASQNPNADTALSTAAACGHDDVVDFLIQRGADVNREADGLPPLMFAARQQSEVHLRIVKSLLRAKANVNCGRFSTPLMCACRGLPETVQLLIASGADVNARRPNGTALLTAIEEGRADVVEILLKHGADLSARTPEDADYPNLTPLEFACKLGRQKIVKLLEAAGAPSEKPGGAMKAPAGVSWNDIRTQLQKRDADLFKSFRKGASPRAIESLEKALGLPLPESFRDFYRLNDGQKPDTTPLVPAPDILDLGYSILPIEEMISDWKMLNKLLKKGEFNGLKANSDKEVRKEWWNEGWLPFASNGTGDYLCLDLAPTEKGQVGQVISVNHESPRREQLASSFSEWLAELAEQVCG